MSATAACVDVGQGDCTVAVDEESGEALLIDCRGGKHRAAVAELERLGLSELRAAIVTHTQQDHFGGVLDVLEELAERFTGHLHFNHDSLLARPVSEADRKVAGQRLRALNNRAREFGDRVKRADDQTPLGTAGSVNWQLLAPAYSDIVAAIGDGNPNLASGVVLIRVGAECVVVGGDAPLSVWERIADHIPKGSVVRWPHHGGAIDGPDAHATLRDILAPSVVLVSVGATNGHGHPSPSFFTAMGGRPGRLICTQATGACVSGGVPGGVCAGTIRVHLDGSNSSPTIDTSVPDHGAVVEGFGNAQCLPPSRGREG